MRIQDIYDRYHIMPNLQLHMYRVAGVAKLICQNFSGKLEEEEVVTATLLHDMGNIIKFDLELFPGAVEPQGLEYWQNIQTQFTTKYGSDEHNATFEIVREIGVSGRVIQLIEAVGFFAGEANFHSDDMASKICDYADTRVTPEGVKSLEERFEDLEKRYAPKYPSLRDKEKREEFRGFLRGIEQQIFKKCRLQPDDITEEKVQELILQLRDFTV